MRRWPIAVLGLLVVAVCSRAQHYGTRADESGQRSDAGGRTYSTSSYSSGSGSPYVPVYATGSQASYKTGQPTSPAAAYSSSVGSASEGVTYSASGDAYSSPAASAAGFSSGGGVSYASGSPATLAAAAAASGGSSASLPPKVHEIHTTAEREVIRVEEYKRPRQVIRIHEAPAPPPEIIRVQAPPEPQKVIRVVQRARPTRVQFTDAGPEVQVVNIPLRQLQRVIRPVLVDQQPQHATALSVPVVQQTAVQAVPAVQSQQRSVFTNVAASSYSLPPPASSSSPYQQATYTGSAGAFPVSQRSVVRVAHAGSYQLNGPAYTSRPLVVASQHQPQTLSYSLGPAQAYSYSSIGAPTRVSYATTVPAGAGSSSSSSTGGYRVSYGTPQTYSAATLPAASNRFTFGQAYHATGPYQTVYYRRAAAAAAAAARKKSASAA